jgi:hypothetical protein
LTSGRIVPSLPPDLDTANVFLQECREERLLPFADATIGDLTEPDVGPECDGTVELK